MKYLGKRLKTFEIIDNVRIVRGCRRCPYLFFSRSHEHDEIFSFASFIIYCTLDNIFYKAACTDTFVDVSSSKIWFFHMCFLKAIQYLDRRFFIQFFVLSLPFVCFKHIKSPNSLFFKHGYLNIVQFIRSFILYVSSIFLPKSTQSLLNFVVVYFSIFIANIWPSINLLVNKLYIFENFRTGSKTLYNFGDHCCQLPTSMLVHSTAAIFIGSTIHLTSHIICR